MNGEKKLSFIVVDDEPLGKELIVGFAQSVPFLEFKAAFEKPMEALAYLQTNEIDIVFTDVQMPGISGIELISSLTNPPLTIFITAHRDFALDGFENGAVDFLVKPVAYSRFLKAANRAKDRISVGKKDESKESLDKIFIKVNGKLVKILLNEILYIEALGDYLKIVTVSESFTTLGTLKSMEEILVPPSFLRVQRSFIVSISSIKSISGNIIELNNGKSISIASIKKDELLRLLGI